MGWTLIPDAEENDDWQSDSDDVELHEHPPRLVTRAEWGAEDPRAPPRELDDFPVPYLVFMHTRSRPCRGKEDCSRAVKEIQEAWMAKGEDDLPFNYLVDHEGFIYEGRGPKADCMRYPEDDKKVAPANGKSINVGFIGSGGIEPPDVLIQGTASLSVILFDGRFLDDAVKLLWYNIPVGDLKEDPNPNEEPVDLQNNQVENCIAREGMKDEESVYISRQLDIQEGRSPVEVDPTRYL